MLGFARPEIIRSRNSRLYDLTLHWPVPRDKPFSNSLPNGSDIIPSPDALSCVRSTQLWQVLRAVIVTYRRTRISCGGEMVYQRSSYRLQQRHAPTWHIQTRNSETTSGPDNPYEIGQDDVWLFFIASGANGLIPHGVDSTVDKASVELLYLVHRIPFRKVNGYSSDFLRFRESFGNTVHNKGLGRAAENSRVCCHNSDWSSTKDGLHTSVSWKKLWRLANQRLSRRAGSRIALRHAIQLHGGVTSAANEIVGAAHDVLGNISAKRMKSASSSSPGGSLRQLKSANGTRTYSA